MVTWVSFGVNFMQAKAKKISNITLVNGIFENIIGCKWTLSILQLIINGINRPGAIKNNVAGLTTKVMNERLRKLVKFGIIKKEIFPEVPPHVEYHLTDFGIKFVGILEAIAALEQELASSETLFHLNGKN